MSLSVISFLPLGTVIGRYCKETFVNIKIFRLIPLWHFLHALLMTIALLLFAIGLTLNIMAQRDWTSLRKSGFHTYGGAVLGAFIAISFVIGFFSQTSVHGQGNLWGTLHAILGHIVIFLGLALILRSDRVTFSRVPCTVQWIVGTWIFTYLVFYFAMAVSWNCVLGPMQEIVLKL
jgi:hypothetical protein